jgi:hypothetical protein
MADSGWFVCTQYRWGIFKGWLVAGKRVKGGFFRLGAAIAFTR